MNKNTLNFILYLFSKLAIISFVGIQPDEVKPTEDIYRTIYLPIHDKSIEQFDNKIEIIFPSATVDRNSITKDKQLIGVYQGIIIPKERNIHDTQVLKKACIRDFILKHPTPTSCNMACVEYLSGTEKEIQFRVLYFN